MEYKILLFIGYWLNLLQNAPTSFATPIIGGRDDTRHQFKMHVSIKSESTASRQDGFVCGGVIISETHILSVAHCYFTVLGGRINHGYDPRLHPLKAVAGSNLFNSRDNIERRVSTIFIPREFESSRLAIADIAVLKISMDWGLRQNHEKIQMAFIDRASRNPHELDNKIGIFCGFGYHTLTRGTHGFEPLQTIPNVRQVLSIKILPEPQYPHYATAICAVNEGRMIRTACIGDSGSPLLVGSTLVGVVSHGPQNCNTNDVPNSFTRISTYLDFIRRTSNEHGDHSDMVVSGEGPTHRLLPADNLANLTYSELTDKEKDFRSTSLMPVKHT